MSDLGQLFGVGTVLVGVVFWFARLEGRVNAVEKDVVSTKARAEADSKAALEMKETLIRMDERLIHLTDLVERLSPRRKPSE